MQALSTQSTEASARLNHFFLVIRQLRYHHASFLERYKILALHNLKKYNRQAKGRGLCEVLLNLIVPRVLEILDDESMQEYGSMLNSRGKRCVLRLQRTLTKGTPLTLLGAQYDVLGYTDRRL